MRPAAPTLLSVSRDVIQTFRAGTRRTDDYMTFDRANDEWRTRIPENATAGKIGGLPLPRPAV